MHELSWRQLPAAHNKPRRDSMYLAWAGSHLIGVTVHLTTMRWDPVSGWSELVPDADSGRARGDTKIHHLLPAWDGTVLAIGHDGRVLSLDVDAATWKPIADPDAKYTSNFGLSAFDPDRGVVVVWGSLKQSGGRKDETFVFDGRAWTKGKKSKQAPDLGGNYRGFSMHYDPTERAVVWLSQSQVGVFDGKTWSVLPLDGGEHLDDWHRIVCVDPSTKRVFGVHRFISKRSVVQVSREGDRYVARQVATFPPAVTRAGSDPGGNAAFDAGIYDPTTRDLVAFDTSNGAGYATSLEPLLT